MQFPDIDPIIFRIGPLAMRWYGLMYILGFVSSYLLVMRQMKKGSFKFDRAAIDDLFFYLILGLIIGARLGYVIFYNPGFYLRNPLQAVAIWNGGMSFHGGLIGTFIAGYIVMTKKKLGFFKTADLIIPTCPIGIGFGRLGNFINGELFGRPSTMPGPWFFPRAAMCRDTRHNSMKCFLKGLPFLLSSGYTKITRSGTGMFLHSSSCSMARSGYSANSLESPTPNSDTSSALSAWDRS